MNTIQLILASAFDFFKAKSPIIAATIVSVLTLVALNFNQLIEIFHITNPIVIEVAKWTNLILLAVTGSRTTNVLEEAKSAEKMPIE